MKISSNGLSFEVLVDDPPCQVPTAGTVLLTMGLGMQLVAWPDAFIQALLQAGYRVVRYDNRDIGLSTHLDVLGTPSMPWQVVKHKLGFNMAHPYTLQDMANDALGLLDALGVAYRPGQVYANSDHGVDFKALADGQLGTRYDWTQDAQVHLKGESALLSLRANQALAVEMGIRRVLS